MTPHPALIQLTTLLTKENVLWALGGSLMLRQYGLVETSNDIDLLVALPDAARTHDLLLTLGTGSQGAPKDPFCTRHFYQYEIDGTSLDVMAGYSTRHDAGVYELPFDASSIVKRVEIGGASVPLSSLEDWFVLYQLIPAKSAKADLIEDYLLHHGVQRPDLLERALQGCLPDAVRGRVETLLSSAK